MAILTGFPPSNTISPSVRIAEVDLSQYSTDQSFHRAGLVGFASKGPINIPTLVVSQRDLNSKFGYPHPESGDPYMLYAAQAYLLVATELWIVRVAQEENVSFEQAETAAVSVVSAGGQINIVSANAGPYVFDIDRFFRFRLNGVLRSNTLLILAGTYAVGDLVNDLNSQLNPAVDGIQFYIATGGKIGVQTTFAYGPNSTLELVSVQNAMYGGTGSVLAMGTAMTQASITSTNDRYPLSASSAGFDLSGLTELDLQIVIDGTDVQLIDNTVQVIDLSSLLLANGVQTATQVVAAINAELVNLPGGWTCAVSGSYITFKTNTYGRDARLRIKSDGTGSSIFGFDDMTYTGGSPGYSQGAASSTMGIVTGTTNSANTVSFTILADSPGIDGNNTQVVVLNDIRQGTFSLSVYNNGVQLEAWGGLTKDQSSRYYVESYIAQVSQWIRVVDFPSVTAPPINGTFNLSGGSDGIPSDPDVQDELLVGNILGFTGLYALSEPEQIDIDLIAVPGHASTQIVLALLDFCQNMRQDCLAIVDPPFGLTVQEIIDWQNGAHPLNGTRFDSDFGALFYPWVKVRDTFNAIDVWCPPSGSVMATIARSDTLAAPWYAPAGTTRGIVPGITDVYSRPTLEERDLMYGNRNTINSIIQFVDLDGFMIWGQKTLQRLPTALDRINVRRMMFVAEKEIRVASRPLLFEPHDAALEKQFVQIATKILGDIQTGRGITDFIVQCDSTLNTPDVIDRNELRARIGIQPVKAAEFIYIEFTINRTGDFSEPDDNF